MPKPWRVGTVNTTSRASAFGIVAAPSLSAAISCGATRPSTTRKCERKSKKERKASADGGDGSPGGEAPRTKRFMDDAPFGPVWGDYTGELDARGRRHGRGDIVYEDNSEYRGGWKDDEYPGA